MTGYKDLYYGCPLGRGLTAIYEPEEREVVRRDLVGFWVGRNQMTIDVEYKIVVRVLLNCFLLYLPAFLVFAAFFLSFLSWAALRCSGFMVA